VTMFLPMKLDGRHDQAGMGENPAPGPPLALASLRIALV
jgi:hypothetical protein